MRRPMGLDKGYAAVKAWLTIVWMMRKVHQWIKLMQIEESARTCTTRSEAQACIRRADEIRQELWGKTMAVRFTSG